MNAEIISIGDELLIGQVVNSNSSWIANQLNLEGFKVFRITSVSDNKEEIINILKEASSRSQIILITGGLGPTSDDITKPSLCEYFNCGLVLNPSVLKQVENFLLSRNVMMNDLNKKQAEVLENCEVISNSIGTAPGMWIEKDNVNYISMPGVPFEMEAMMLDTIIPKLISKFRTPYIHHYTILTQGIAESKLAETIEPWEKQLPPSFKLAYLPSPGIVKLRISATGEEGKVKESVENKIKSLRDLISDFIFGYNDDTLEVIIGQLLASNCLTLTTVESCTGGKIANMITSVPGSSAYFKGGIVPYSNELKESLLHINRELLLKYGAVSKEVVEEMAANACNLFKSDFAVATSGIAGCSGGTSTKPVGTTWIAVAERASVKSQNFLFGDNRERNIIRASITALNMLRKFILTKNI